MSSQPSFKRNREIIVNMPDLPPAARRQIAEIARTTLGIETLETRYADRLDFHDTAVWSIRAALEAAYLAGAAAAKEMARQGGTAGRHSMNTTAATGNGQGLLRHAGQATGSRRRVSRTPCTVRAS